MVKILKCIDGTRIKPTGTRRSGDYQHGTFETTDADKFVEGQLGSLFNCVGGAKTGVDSKWSEGVLTVKLIYLFLGWSIDNEVLPTHSDRVPVDERFGTSRGQRVGWLFNPFVHHFVKLEKNGVCDIQGDPGK